jgi:NAD+ kinase
MAPGAKAMRIAIFGGSFNPPCLHHLEIISRIVYRVDKVIVVPCGYRQDKPSANIIAENHRKAMAELAFAKIPKVELDCYDLNNKVYTPTYYLQQRYERLFLGSVIWHVIGGDIVVGGRNGNSEIHRVWHCGSEIWQKFNFTVIVRPGYEVAPSDLPPHSELIEIQEIFGSGTMVRSRIARGESIDELVPLKVAEYIQAYNLYVS